MGLCSQVSYLTQKLSERSCSKRSKVVSETQKVSSQLLITFSEEEEQEQYNYKKLLKIIFPYFFFTVTSVWFMVCFKFVISFIMARLIVPISFCTFFWNVSFVEICGTRAKISSFQNVVSAKISSMEGLQYWYPF